MRVATVLNGGLRKWIWSCSGAKDWIRSLETGPRIPCRFASLRVLGQKPESINVSSRLGSGKLPTIVESVSMPCSGPSSTFACHFTHLGSENHPHLDKPSPQRENFKRRIKSEYASAAPV